jgi:hypothetical protein
MKAAGVHCLLLDLLLGLLLGLLLEPGSVTGVCRCASIPAGGGVALLLVTTGGAR